MSDLNLVPFRTVSYQHRAYLAQAAAQAALEAEGRLLGWGSWEDLAGVHWEFARRWFRDVPVPRLDKGTGSSSSRYYSREHRLKILARDLEVLTYAHELAHAVESTGRGNGHNPRWAGRFLEILRELDGHAAGILEEQFRLFGMTIAKRSSEQSRLR